MKNSLARLLENSGSYSERDKALLEEKLETRVLEKNEIYLEKGEVCSSVSFLLSGAIYQYQVNNDLDKTVIELNTPDTWIINSASFTSRAPSEYHIEAYERSVIYNITIESIHELIAASESFLQLGKILEQSNSRVSFFDNNLSPEEKYRYVLENRPSLIQVFPQKLIASYLKITPETLSRVRKNLSGN